MQYSKSTIGKTITYRGSRQPSAFSANWKAFVCASPARIPCWTLRRLSVPSGCPALACGRCPWCLVTFGILQSRRASWDICTGQIFAFKKESSLNIRVPNYLGSFCLMSQSESYFLVSCMYSPNSITWIVPATQNRSVWNDHGRPSCISMHVNPSVWITWGNGTMTTIGTFRMWARSKNGQLNDKPFWIDASFRRNSYRWHNQNLSAGAWVCQIPPLVWKFKKWNTLRKFCYAKHFESKKIDYGICNNIMFWI